MMTLRIVLAATVAALLLPGTGQTLAQEQPKPAPKPPVIRTYDVSDLVMPPRNFARIFFAISRPTGPLGQEPPPEDPLRGVDIDGPFGQDWWSPEELLCDLIDLIKQTLDPGSWEDGTDHAIRGRAGVLIVSQAIEVHERIQALLNELRKVQDQMISVRVRFVAPKRADVDRIVAEKRSVAATPENKVELAKLAGETLAEARFVAMAGQTLPIEAVGTARKALVAGPAAEPPAARNGISGWILSRTTPEGAVRLDVSLKFERPDDKAPVRPAASQQTLRVWGSYIIPDGGMLLASGATLPGEDGGKEVYALIDVQVLGAPKAK